MTANDPQAMRFDHAVIAVGDLDVALTRYGKLGFVTAVGGRHERLGTHNGIVRFGLDYLELLAVFDESLAEAAGPGRKALVDYLRRRTGAIGYAVATTTIDLLATRMRGSLPEPVGPIAMDRRRPDGTMLTWRLLTPGGVAWRKPWPFFISWDMSDDQRLALERPGTHTNGITGVAGASVLVGDLEHARTLYERMGAAVSAPITIDGIAERKVMARFGAFPVELRSPSGPGQAQQDLDREGEGLCEILLRAAALDKTRRYLDDAGIRYSVAVGPRVVVDPDATLGARLVIVG